MSESRDELIKQAEEAFDFALRNGPEGPEYRGYAAKVIADAMSQFADRETSHLISIIADIRQKTGVGAKPMLTELADTIAAKIGTGWLPIESAPRDGTPIIGYWKGYKRPCVMWWNLADKAFESWTDRNEEPSHYMPLPSPPAKVEG